jgi:GTPase
VAALRDAVARVAQGHARVLVLGEAERGKSTLVGTVNLGGGVAGMIGGSVG